MAANSISNIMPKILAAGLLALREQAVMPRLVNRDFGSEAAQKGQTIDVPKSVPQTVSDVTPAPSQASATGATPGLVQIPLDQWKHTDFYMTDKERVEVAENQHFVPGQTREAIKALGNTMDVYIHSQASGVYGYVGTAGTTPFSAIVDTTDARKVLNNQLAPLESRNLVIDPDAEAKALGNAQLTDFDKTGDQGPRIEGDMGRKLGFRWVMSQNVQTHTAGTAASVVCASAVAAGGSTITLTNGTGAGGTILIGDVFTIAGDTQTYVSKSSVTLVSSIKGEIDISPGLVAGVSTETVTLKATHVNNLGFHPNAFAFATRPLAGVTNGLGNEIMVATDPMTGLSLRLEVSRQFKQEIWDFDVLYGGKLTRPELAVRVAG